jgi:predicted amidohydrolase
MMGGGNGLKVGIIQLAIDDKENKQERLSRVGSIIDGLRGFDLIVLPELWNVGFFAFDDYKSSSEDLKGETISFLSSKAAEIGSYIFTGSFIERRGDQYFNLCALLDRKGAVLDTYRKMHLFGYGSAEGKILTSGDDITVVSTEFGKVGMCICYDLRFPELYRKMVDEGAEFIINCAAWPYPRVEHWTQLNQVRAIESLAYIISCGCAGASKGMGFIGRSIVVDPWGTVVSCAAERETVLKVDINPKMVKSVRDEFPALRDRKITF